MKRALFINAYGLSQENRVEPILTYFENKNWECFYISSNFNHHQKNKEVFNENMYLIDVPHYNKNTSLRRLWSHIVFTIRAFKKAKSYSPDLIYIKIPPNYLAKKIGRYFRKKNTTVIFDIFDLWPESLPINKRIKSKIFFVFNHWRKLRDNSLKYADLIFIECNLYQNYLPSGFDYKLLYLFKEDYSGDAVLNIHLKDQLKLCYIGGINSLIDFDLLHKVLSKLSKQFKVIINVIGDGVNRNKFLNILDILAIDYIFHGLVYDDKKKTEIIRESHFGLNIMKSNVVVGLTMKSIDYLMNGTPLLNNIQGDTEQLVTQYNVGININESFLAENEITCIDQNSINLMKKNSRLLYQNLFSHESSKARISEILDKFIH